MLAALSAEHIIHINDETPAWDKKNLSSQKKVALRLPDSLVLLAQELIESAKCGRSKRFLYRETHMNNILINHHHHHHPD
jgi:hypothetical protein